VIGRFAMRHKRQLSTAIRPRFRSVEGTMPVSRVADEVRALFRAEPRKMSPSALGNSQQIHCLGRGPTLHAKGIRPPCRVKLGTSRRMGLHDHVHRRQSRSACPCGSWGDQQRSCRARVRQVRVHRPHLRDIRVVTASPAYEAFSVFFRCRVRLYRRRLGHSFLRWPSSRSRVTGCKRRLGPGLDSLFGLKRRHLGRARPYPQRTCLRLGSHLRLPYQRVVYLRLDSYIHVQGNLEHKPSC
jgi:hypothetical protein